MEPTRRDFLRLGLGSSVLLASGTMVPGFLARAAGALSVGGLSGERVLVVLELTGGNDGLNTVVPASDDAYRKRRPRLRLEKAKLHKVDDHIGLHPALGGMGKLLDQRALAIVQSVGYPNPNRSHFESMAIWQTARLDASAQTEGWLARRLEQPDRKPGDDAPALHVGTRLPQALCGGGIQVPAVAGAEQLHRRIGVPGSADAARQRADLDAVSRAAGDGPGSLVDFVQRSMVTSYASSARLESVLQGNGSAAGYPEEYGLAKRLKLIGQMIKAGLGTSIYYTQLDGFDTHANQEWTHYSLLREMGDSLRAFADDLSGAGHGDRVLVLVFSEFGRRVAENASAGTDHGTAAPVFVVGKAVQAGLHGPYPNLTDLVDGDPKHAIDFRQVYATLLDRWLGCPSERVLGERFGHVPIVRGTV